MEIIREWKRQNAKSLDFMVWEMGGAMNTLRALGNL